MSDLTGETDRWNWFLSADISGRWIVTSGYADVTMSGRTMQAVLQYAPDADPRAHVRREVDDADAEHGAMTAIVTGKEVDPYTLRGNLYVGEGMMSVILTDGTTVLGLALGPESHKPNLA